MDNDREIVAAAQPLLALIRKHESRGNYDIVFTGAKTRPPKPLTQMTLRDVLAWQQDTVQKGSFSSAAGAYQFIRPTLNQTIKQMGVSLDAIWTPELQDRMAVHLLRGRGFVGYLNGTTDENAFLIALAKEWASFPNPATGRSFYAGDGVNKAGVGVDEVRRAAQEARRIAQRPSPALPVAVATGGGAAVAVAANTGVPWPLVLGGLAVVAAAVVFLLWRRK